MKPTEQKITQLVAQMKSWFRMTEEEARERAMGFLILAYGWGTPPSGTKLEKKIKRDLAKEFESVSDEARATFEVNEAQRLSDQKIYISGKPSTPRFRP